ncbi:GNAT family N-acetyltransferase [Sediminihabitans luteus]|nr:GNAT family N-acetyltransferase [Sediminihabitans luteus]
MTPPGFARFEPDPPRARPSGPVMVRAATTGDLDAIREVQEAAQREEVHADALAAVIDDPDRCLVVAVVDGALVGWAKTHRYTDPDPVAPGGHYLGGVTVHPAARRRGAGHALTQARLDWVAERADVAWYVVNARNLASLALHARFGFVEVARGAGFRGVLFDGGEGILLRADLPRRALA